MHHSYSNTYKKEAVTKFSLCIWQEGPGSLPDDVSSVLAFWRTRMASASTVPSAVTAAPSPDRGSVVVSGVQAGVSNLDH